MNKRIYIGVKYWDTENTTTGVPNKRTWRMSIAINARAFHSKKELLKNGYEYKTQKQFRRLNLGDSIEEHIEEMENLRCSLYYEEELG